MGWPGQLTHRQFSAWQQWTEAEMNEPGRVEHYLMQVAAEVRRVLSRKPASIKLENFKLKFTPKKPSKPLSEKESNSILNMTKAIWLVRAGAVKGEGKRGRRKRS